MVGVFVTTGTSELTWQAAGDPQVVTYEPDGQIALEAADPTTAGVLSSVIDLPDGCNAVMVTAEIADAAAQAVTFAIHDAETGEPIGYWQNPVAIDAPAREAAAMNFTRPAQRVRVFIGTDGQPSTAAVHSVEVVPLWRSDTFDPMLYGHGVNAEKSVAQSFTARGDRFGGLTLRGRFSRPINGTPPDLVAQLYEWKDDAATTRAGQPLARVAVSGRTIPASTRLVDRDLMLPFDAPVEPGRRYFVEITEAPDAAPPPVDGPVLQYIVVGAPDAIAGGEMFQNDRPTGWDANTNIYFREW